MTTLHATKNVELTERVSSLLRDNTETLKLIMRTLKDPKNDPAPLNVLRLPKNHYLFFNDADEKTIEVFMMEDFEKYFERAGLNKTEADIIKEIYETQANNPFCKDLNHDSCKFMRLSSDLLLSILFALENPNEPINEVVLPI